MQIVSLGDNLHEVSEPVFQDKWEKYHQFVICWNLFVLGFNNPSILMGHFVSSFREREVEEIVEEIKERDREER